MSKEKRLNEKTLTFEEHQKLHNEYWDSLTEEQKQKMADEAQATSTVFGKK